MMVQFLSRLDLELLNRVTEEQIIFCFYSDLVTPVGVDLCFLLCRL
jgi:hypothetical protein